jgi:integrase
MSQRKIKVTKYSDSNRPHFKFVVNYREAGQRRRKFFGSKEQAQSFAGFKNAELKRSGIAHAEFPERLRIMAQNAVEQLHPFGKEITDAVKHYVAHLKATEKSCSAVKLVKELVTAKEKDGKSVRHVNDLRNRLNIFAAKFDGQMVAEITGAEIDDWLGSLPVSPVTRNHYRRLIVLAFNFAVRRGYAASNPAVDTPKAREPKTKPGILTVDEARALLVNAAPEIVPYLAIGLFAGLRRAEIERLDWSEIDFESGHIEVTAEKSKSKMANRFITIQPNLRKWLMPHRQLKGSVTPQERWAFRQLFDQARTAAAITDWPDNALRHSFASYHVARFKNAQALALEMGHRDSGILFNNYRALVKPKEAERYWGIKPGSMAKVVQMPTRSSDSHKGKGKILPGWRIQEGDKIRPMTPDEINEVLLHGKIVSVRLLNPGRKPRAAESENR